MKPDKERNLCQEQGSGAILGPDFDMPWFLFRSYRPTTVVNEVE